MGVWGIRGLGFGVIRGLMFEVFGSFLSFLLSCFARIAQQRAGGFQALIAEPLQHQRP